MRLGVEDEPVVVPAGTLALVPPLVVHGFRNGGDAELRYLNLHAPGRRFGDYLRAMRDGRSFAYDQHAPPEDGGRPASEAVRRRRRARRRPAGPARGARSRTSTSSRISEVRSEPGGASPPPHVHRRHAESFYVLEGELTFGGDGQRAPGNAPGPGCRCRRTCLTRSPARDRRRCASSTSTLRAAGSARSSAACTPPRRPRDRAASTESGAAFRPVSRSASASRCALQPRPGAGAALRRHRRRDHRLARRLPRLEGVQDAVREAHRDGRVRALPHGDGVQADRPRRACAGPGRRRGAPVRPVRPWRAVPPVGRRPARAGGRVGAARRRGGRAGSFAQPPESGVGHRSDTVCPLREPARRSPSR